MVATLKGYLVHEKIKDGSVGTVWRATDGANRVFALKQLSPKHARIGRKRREFKREATLTQTLSHPQVIKVHEYVSMEQPFFVMEYFRSENLKVAIRDLPEWVVGRELKICRQVADGLAFIHSRGIVHRDIKPENVLLNEAGETRLIDFSLAQNGWDRLLQFGRRTEGTPLYMAPEQVRGEKCDVRSDIYSFGALVYEVFTKRPPFQAPSEAKVLEMQLKAAPASMSTYAKVAPELDALVLRMLSKRRDERPPDMATVLYELAKLDKKAPSRRAEARPRIGTAELPSLG
jgi:serine/threonine-protein kinase